MKLFFFRKYHVHTHTQILNFTYEIGVYKTHAGHANQKYSASHVFFFFKVICLCYACALLRRKKRVCARRGEKQSMKNTSSKKKDVKKKSQRDFSS